MPGEERGNRGGREALFRWFLLAAVLPGLLVLSSAARAAGGRPASSLAGAIEAIAPGATAVSGGWRFRVQDVVVSVLADEAGGLLRVVARTGELSERDLGLIAAALGPDLVPDLAARVVSVRGLVCSAVLAPLRGLTEGMLRRAVEGAVQAARDAVVESDPLARVGAGVPAAVPDRRPPLPPHGAPLRGDPGPPGRDPGRSAGPDVAAGSTGWSATPGRPDAGLPVDRLPLP